MRKQLDAEALERYRQEQKRCLGIAICQLRTERGLTPKQLAERAKISVRWLQRLEANRLHTNYSIGRIDRIAQALEVELYDVYERAGKMLGLPPWLEGTQDDE